MGRQTRQPIYRTLPKLSKSIRKLRKSHSREIGINIKFEEVLEMY